MDKKKLMMAFFAILMVVKMIKVKVMFLAPVLLGVGTAKKLFLKLLLFVFPAFAQIFKFCAYYHAAHTKYHHHHHQIAHHHHHVPVPVPVHVDHSHMPVHLDHPPPEISYESPSGPPSGHGGGWGSSNFISRNELLGPHQIEENELESWGLMSKGSFSVPASALYPQSHPISFPAFLEDPKINRNSYLADATTLLHQKPIRQGPVPTPHQIPSPVYVPSEEELLKQQKLLAARQQLHRKVVPHSPTNGIVHQNIQVSRPLLVAGDKTSEQKLALAKLQQQQHQIETLKHQQQMMLERQEQEFLKHRNHIENLQLTTEASTVAVTYDPFYSPILQKMDNVFVQLGFNEEACRERLVCSMYKTPARFSPHSNLISAELSR
ncbi:hypothetical protein C0J52_16933 [Blattella germanica]|nr:hypothetical protein C0J52_16933 [Blattella germanica]